jgi:iron complex outermembrane receptor protein
VTNPFARPKGVTVESLFGFQERGGSSGSVTLNTRKYSASVNSGLIDGTYMLYGRLSRITSAGYRDNAWVAMDSYFLGGIRFYENMTLRFHLFGGPITDGLAYSGLPKFAGEEPDLRRQNLAYWEADSAGTGYAYAQPRRRQEAEYFSQPHYELLQEWRLGGGATLSQTLFYYTGEGYFDYDASWADTSLLRIGSAYGIPASANPTNALVRAFVGNKQWGWLPRLELAGADNDLTLGMEMRFHRSTHYGTIAFAEGLPAGYDPDYRFYSYEGARQIMSAFVHNIHRVTPRLTVMTDVQAVRNRYAIDREKYLGNDFHVDYFFVNPRAGVNYNIDERWHAYASAAYTSREPRMRNLYAAEDSYFGATPQFAADTAGGVVRYDYSRPLAKPEHLLDLEVGSGYSTEALHLTWNVFWMEFYDELVKSGQVDIFGQPVTGNAERSRHIGAEFDGSVRVTDALTVGGNLAVSRNRLVRYSVLDDAGLPVSLDGNPIAGFPDVLANVRVTYASNGAAGSLLLKHVGSFATDNTNSSARRNDAYTVLDASASCDIPRLADGGGVTLRAEVRNLLNSLYFASGEGDAFFPAAERNYLLGLTVHL